MYREKHAYTNILKKQIYKRTRWLSMQKPTSYHITIFHQNLSNNIASIYHLRPFTITLWQAHNDIDDPITRLFFIKQLL